MGSCAFKPASDEVNLLNLGDRFRRVLRKCSGINDIVLISRHSEPQVSGEMRVEPRLQLVARDDPGRDSFEEGDGFILLVRRTDSPRMAIPLHELEEAEECHPLVPIRHRVIAD